MQSNRSTLLYNTYKVSIQSQVQHAGIICIGKNTVVPVFSPQKQNSVVLKYAKLICKIIIHLTRSTTSRSIINIMKKSMNISEIYYEYL